ncbi:MAG: type I-MYXAN CRISPR-associated protein Cmx8 [Planctomycetota bacterium]
MSKVKVPKQADPQSITITYDLHDLPTAQHRAGLAGLVLQIRLMEKRHAEAELKKIPVIERLSKTFAKITFTPESLQAVFDELYAARVVEAFRKQPDKKSKNKVLKREEFITIPNKITGESKQEKRYVYDEIQPTGLLQQHYLDDGEQSPWLKLWRDMLWNIPRGINTTRAPFIKISSDHPCQEGSQLWDELCKYEKKIASSEFQTSEISGALLLGAQSVNAEGIGFLGRVEQNLLLHFWQIVVLTFVPQVLKRDGKPEAKGYSLCIPDVSDLEAFVDCFPEMLATLSSRKSGFRPTDSLIEIPVQSNLEFLRYLKTLASGKAERKGWSEAVSAIESFHMIKIGNNIKLLGHAMVANRPKLVSNYERIQKNYRNPLFRAALILSLLYESPWYANLLEVFAEQPWPFFVEHEQTPRFMPRFGKDARIHFQTLQKDYHNIMTSGITTTTEPETDRLSRIVYRLVKKYVQDRTLSKLGKKLENYPEIDFKGKLIRKFDNDFHEKQQKVCSETFLAMRSRHDQEFVSYFAGSICSTVQALKLDDYAFLTQILLRKSNTNPTGSNPPSWEDVKALAMIACSASAFYTKPNKTQPQGANS